MTSQSRFDKIVTAVKEYNAHMSKYGPQCHEAEGPKLQVTEYF